MRKLDIAQVIFQISLWLWESLKIRTSHRRGGRGCICLEAYKVNNISVKDAYPLSLIEKIFSGLPEASFFTSSYLKDGFWQNPRNETFKDKVVFAVPKWPLYQFSTRPFGLCKASHHRHLRLAYSALKRASSLKRLN